MELDSVDGKRHVGQCHDEPVVAASRHGEVGRQTLLADHERVVSAGLEGLGKPAEDRRPVVRHARALPMTRLRSAGDGPAVECRDRLMAETDPEKRYPRTFGLGDRRHGLPGLFGPTRARGDDDGARTHPDHLGGSETVIARDAHVGVELAERLHEVEREGVVVVDDEDHANHSRASPIARKRAAAFASASAYSFSGTESATMPAPAWTRH